MPVLNWENLELFQLLLVVYELGVLAQFWFKKSHKKN